MPVRVLLVALGMFALGALAGWVASGAQEKKAAPAGTPLMDVAGPVRDGAVLRADVWLPKPAGRFCTPVFDKAVAHGYAVVIQDASGRCTILRFEMTTQETSKSRKSDNQPHT
ncbi:MAG TPA: hypothetical protein VGF61_17880 [Candidatus Acidoferrum sp.]